MLKSYWTIAWRTLVRNKVYTLVNVLGLALGICACLVIWAIVHYEFSFDRHHPDGARIFRVNSYEQYMKSEPEHMVPAVLPEIAPLIGKGVSGIAVVAPYELFGNTTAAVNAVRGQKKGYRSAPVIAGPEYFRIMPYEWLAGDERSALAEPFGVVLTESKARLYFGAGPLNGMIGGEIVYSDSLRVHVTGIVKGWSEHTDFPYQEFISWPTMEHSWLWAALGMRPSNQRKGIPWSSRLLVKLEPKADAKQVGAVLAATAEREGWNRSSVKRIALQPLSAIHFSPAGDEGAMRTSQLSTLFSLMTIAIFILALAIINYVNLATAQSLAREKEISIRKVMGGGRSSLMLQLLAETFLLTALAGLVAVLLVRPVLGAFQQFVPQDLSFAP